MFRPFFVYRLGASVLVAVLCSCLAGCTDKQLQIAAQLTAGLNDLIQNKAIAEQAVREVKAVCSVANGDPACEHARSLYEEASGLNDQLIGLIAAGTKPSLVRSIHGTQPSTVRDAAVRFLSQSSIIISPGLDTRSIPLERVIVIPESLPQAVRRVNPATRVLMANSYEKQVRWADWDAIPAAGDVAKGQKELP